ncbi:MAG: LamG domain-containing protein [Sedimentisphaerales bacterium]|nr:LamG domain-containing protein [Sedimentisphaerales bacterium]
MNYKSISNVVLIIFLLTVIFSANAFCAEKLLEWKFENNLIDTSGNGIDGTEFNSPAYTSDGALDYALVSDGTDCAYVLDEGMDPNAYFPVDPNATWTVNAWVYLDAQPNNWDVMWAMGAKPSGNGTAISRSIYCNSIGNIVFTDGSGLGGHYLVTSAPWDPNSWQMITTTYDGTDVRVYKNASLVGIMAFAFADAPREFRIPSNPGWGTYMAGRFDELTIWDDALTQTEIFDLVIPGVLPEGTLSTEVVYYEMGDPNEGGVLPDHSGNGNDGLFETNSGTVPEWVNPGVIGDCLTFDGGQKIKVPATVSQNIQFSVAFYFKAGWQPYTSAFYHEKGTNGSEFVIRADSSTLQVFSKDQYWSMVFYMAVDFSAYLNGTWNHMAVSSDGQVVTLYVNGEIIETAEYQRSDDKTAMTGSIGYKIDDGGYLGSWGDIAYIDEFQSFKGVLTQSQVQAMIANGNFDLDLDVDIDDLRIIASDWLDDETASAGSQLVIDDFELGVAGWQVHVSTTYPGTGTISSTTNAYSGVGAMRWDYDLPATVENNNYTAVETDLGAGTDLSGYDQMSLELYRHAGNTAESLLYVIFVDTTETTIAEAWIQGSNCVSEPADEWDTWLIDLDDLKGPQGSGSRDSSVLTDIRYILIGCGSWERNDARTGTIDIDDVKLAVAPVCSEDQITDINGDCKVNLIDLAEFAINWLVGVN